MRTHHWLCLAATALALGACDDDSTEETTISREGTPAAAEGVPSFATVKQVALEELGKCPRQKSREYLSADGRQQRGIAESPMLFCDGLPAIWYIRYQDADGFEKDPGRNPTVELPYFLNGNVFVTAVLTADEGAQRTVPGKIKADCGCGEVQQP